MNRPTLLIALAAVLLPGLASADKTTVYKTTDANGNTVYSQVETTGSETQQVDGRSPDAPVAAAAEEKPKSDTETACANATAHLGVLNSGKRLQRDKDGDGKPEDLTPEEIASEKDLAQRQMTAFCAPAPEG
jgi:tRNA A37 threonylcarbamoyladenosine modification protein TsaB